MSSIFCMGGVESRCLKGDTVNDLAAFLRNEVTSPEQRNMLLFIAAGEGRLDLVKLLLPRADPKSNNSGAWRQAAEHGHLALVNTDPGF